MTETSPPQDFTTLGLSRPLLETLRQAGHVRPSPIQIEAIPLLLQGRDLLAVAQTGSGKTAAYALPILQRLGTDEASRVPGTPRALILAPTRELASQIAGVCRTLGRRFPLRTRVACGGMKRDLQVKALEEGVDILVATPGRLLDLLEGGTLHLEAVKTLVLDEADQMLDEDFLNAMAVIAQHLPERRQTILCSATMPEEIVTLSRKLLHNPDKITFSAETVTPRRIRQEAMFVEATEKPEHVTTLLKTAEGRSMIFVRTKANAEKLALILKRGGIRCEILHGDRTQGARNQALDAFRTGRVPALVATDVAARGLDIEDVALVINYDLPDTPEIYVHRIGRTARAGKRGAAMTLCSLDERSMLRAIEKHIGMRLRIAN